MQQTKKITCISDIHGHLIDIKPCDILLLSGDIVPLSCHNVLKGAKWLNDTFYKYCHKLLQKGVDKIILTPGNHDFVFQLGFHYLRTDNLPWVCLIDQEYIYQDLKIYGTPWQPEFYNWAFNLKESELYRKWQQIPDDTDILICHGPPHGYQDHLPLGKHCGSPSLTARMKELEKLKLMACGHIHYAYGKTSLVKNNQEEALVINAAIVDHSYQVRNNPITIKL
jgi:Icc-related predicted phosphoesterase